MPAIAREGHKQLQPRGKVTRDRDEQREGTQRAAPTPSLAPAVRGQRISRDEARDGDRAAPGMVLHSLPHPPSRGTFGDVSAATTAAAIRSQCWTRVLTGPNWQSGLGQPFPAGRAWGMCGLTRTGLGRGGCSKGHFVVQGWGCQPGRTRSSKGHNRDSDSEGGDTSLSPPLSARHRPPQIHSRAQGPSHRSARDWEPRGFSCSSQTAPEELSPQLSSGQGQGTTEELGSSIPRPGKSP